MVDLNDINKIAMNAHFIQDPLQDELTQENIRKDDRFKRAYYTNYTGHFLNSLEFSIMRREPVSISIMGRTRSGKSTSAMTIQKKIQDFNILRIKQELDSMKFDMEVLKRQGRINWLINEVLNTEILKNDKTNSAFFKAKDYVYQEAVKKRQISIKNICAHEFEYGNRLKKGDFDTCYQIDEAKTGTYGLGAVAKRSKLVDIQNIIAVNNISSIWLRPDTWATGNAHYGLMSFGKAENDKQGNPLKTRINRFMLYNLQESKSVNFPLGMVYIPLIWDILPKEESDRLNREYLSKKLDWVKLEQISEEDVFNSDRFKLAYELSKDETFKSIKGFKNKLPYVRTQCTSSTTNNEIDDIMRLANQIIIGNIKEDKIQEILKKGELIDEIVD